MPNIYRTTTDIQPYPSNLTLPDKYPPAPDPPNNSMLLPTGVLSPSPITVPKVVKKFTTDLPNMSPSPITVPDSSTNKTIKFQPNLFYNELEDIHWYNNRPITESQYNWLVDRHNKGLEIPDKFTYPPKILYKEVDGTCWFKGYKISCETYYGLEKSQEKNTMELAKSHRKPGLYNDPLERFTLLWLREIGKGEEAVIKNNQIERDWKIIKNGPIDVYRNFMMEPGKPTDVSNDMHRIDDKYKRTTIPENIREETDLLARYYNKDKYKTEDNNVYKEVMDAIGILNSITANKTDQIKASNYLKDMQDKMNEESDWVIGGKKGKKTKKRKTVKKRKTNKKRKSRKK